MELKQPDKHVLLQYEETFGTIWALWLNCKTLYAFIFFLQFTYVHIWIRTRVFNNKTKCGAAIMQPVCKELESPPQQRKFRVSID